MGKHFFDLHRHDEFSEFDGFGKPAELVKIAQGLGYKALGTSNHGNTSGLVEHYFRCKEAGIKPVLGTEAYFQPIFDKERKKYHLCLFVKDIRGYKNLNKIMTEANADYFYYKPVVDFKLLKKYHEGLICTTACIASYTSQSIVNGNDGLAIKALKKFKEIFGEDLYVEIQPYTLYDEENIQAKVNIKMIQLAEEMEIKCILTSDSHFGSKHDFPTYIKMHEIGKTNLDVEKTYGERYMPTEEEIIQRFVEMHSDYYEDEMGAELLACEMVDNMEEIYNKVEDEILEKLELKLPKISEDAGYDSHKELIKLVKQGLKRMGKYNKKYLDRCKEEISVIHHHGFEDYFLMVQDYVNWARRQGIEVGPGRGSVCNCLVACAIGITSVDSIKFGLDFSRFMRKDKRKLPDIDVDFETGRRDEVIAYVVEKYKGRAIQICSYGLYKEDILINDLCKVCNVDETDKKEVKEFLKSCMVDGNLDEDLLKHSSQYSRYNRYYDYICVHFKKLLKKMRYIGTHAAGVAVVGTDITDYTAIMRRQGSFRTSYDLNDIERINAIKFDMLGLKTMSEIREMREQSGCIPPDDYLDSDEFYEYFREGYTDGIFQFEKSAPKNILNTIHADCIEDIIAVNALNRPGPLSLKMPQRYAENKLNENEINEGIFYEYTKDTHGTVLYQEQITSIVLGIGNLSYEDSDMILKIMKKEENLNKMKDEVEILRKKFIQGAKENGVKKEEANEIYNDIVIYSFNKGHATGYALIATEQMWYKVYCPCEFWYSKIKYAGNDADRNKYIHLAVKSGIVVFLPHVNYAGDTQIRVVEGEKAIQLGLNTLKGVGDKASEQIAENRKSGRFRGYEDFYARCKSRAVTTRVLEILKEQGALEFRKDVYMKRVVKYNSALYGR